VNVKRGRRGEEFTDVTARMGNARRLEARLIELLATRTGKLSDVLDRREGAGARPRGSRSVRRPVRYLRAHAALSTLSIYVHEPLPVSARGLERDRRGLQAVLAELRRSRAGGIRGLGIVIPFGALATAAWLGAKRWRKGQPPRTTEA